MSHRHGTVEVMPADLAIESARPFSGMPSRTIRSFRPRRSGGEPRDQNDAAAAWSGPLAPYRGEMAAPKTPEGIRTRDETCWFLAIDFDKQFWQRDALAFLKTCAEKDVPAALERSRSGNGGHVWIFFSEPVPAVEARKLGAHLVTETMERYPDLGFESV